MLPGSLSLAGHLTWIAQLYDGEEGNTMTPLYTLLLCLPAALVLIVCAGGVTVLWPGPPCPPQGDRRQGRRRAV